MDREMILDLAKAEINKFVTVEQIKAAREALHDVIDHTSQQTKEG